LPLQQFQSQPIVDDPGYAWGRPDGIVADGHVPDPSLVIGYLLGRLPDRFSTP
jgi:hypothetical protein